MSMQKDVERLEHSRVAPNVHHIGADVVEEIKELLAENAEENMVLNIHLGLDKKGYHVVYLVFNDAETGDECGEFNASHPCPPFTDC